MPNLYDVSIEVSGRIVSNITVQADNTEDAEDKASEEITLTAKKAYEKTESTKPAAELEDTRPLQETTV